MHTRTLTDTIASLIKCKTLEMTLEHSLPWWPHKPHKCIHACTNTQLTDATASLIKCIGRGALAPT